MNPKSKKIFLALSIIVPFLLYSAYYYTRMIKNAPYKFSEFKSITLKAGIGEKIEKTYNSEKQELTYLNSSDSTIVKRVKLTKETLLILHRKATELGFWDWPSNMLEDTTGTSPKYYLEFDYERKKKVIEIDAAFSGAPKLKDAAIQLIKIVEGEIDAADAIYTEALKKNNAK